MINLVIHSFIAAKTFVEILSDFDKFMSIKNIEIPVTHQSEIPQGWCVNCLSNLQRLANDMPWETSPLAKQ